MKNTWQAKFLSSGSDFDGRVIRSGIFTEPSPCAGDSVLKNRTAPKSGFFRFLKSKSDWLFSLFFVGLSFFMISIDIKPFFNLTGGWFADFLNLTLSMARKSSQFSVILKEHLDVLLLSGLVLLSLVAADLFLRRHFKRKGR